MRDPETAATQFPAYLTDATPFIERARPRLLSDAEPHDELRAGPSDFDLNETPHDTAGIGSERRAAPDGIVAELRPAAVLVGIVARQPLTVLLTRRTAHLSEHGGQIAFPGGRIEPSDETATAAALRETREEIGLHTHAIQPLGFLPSYRTSTGYRICPLVGVIQPPFDVFPDAREVADIFEVPLAYLMTDANHRIDSRIWQGIERRFYAMPYEQHYIWGATAGILKSLHRSLTEE